MDIQQIYAARSLPREPLEQTIVDIIAKLKISFKAPFRRPTAPQPRRQPSHENPNWRENVLVDVVRKVREKDDPDYDTINAHINKLTKQTFVKLIGEILAKLEARDELFRLRVTTLLFDRGIRQNFFAPIMADAYVEIVKKHPSASKDLETQVSMFDSLYDANKVVSVPPSSDPGYDEAILEWTKHKEMKRGFAVYIAELYTRKLIPEERMSVILNTVFHELRESIQASKTSANEEHVDALVRFLYAVAPKTKIGVKLQEILKLPRESVPSLTMKSRFKLEDALAGK